MSTSDPLLREVDEAVQHDRMVALWKQYRRPVMLVAITLILFTFGMTDWRKYQEKQAGIALEHFSAAQELFAHEKYDDAAKAFAEIAAHPASPELADIAHLWQARALVGARKNADAIAIFSALAEHPQSKQLIWRDLACLRLVALDATKNACLRADDASPLMVQRKITHAAQLWDQKKPEEARRILETIIIAPDTSPTSRSRAQNYLSVIPAAPKNAAQQTAVPPATKSAP